MDLPLNRELEVALGPSLLKIALALLWPISKDILARRTVTFYFRKVGQPLKIEINSVRFISWTTLDIEGQLTERSRKRSVIYKISGFIRMKHGLCVGGQLMIQRPRPLQAEQSHIF